jgi:hypothetical protein
MAIVIDGNNTPTAGGIGYGDGTELAFTAAGTSGQPIVSGGAGAPTFRPYTLPASDGSASQVLQTNGSGALSFATVSAGLTLGTPVNSTSGTSITFTGIPAGVKQITISFLAVSTDGAGSKVVRIGDSGGIETADYASSGSRFATTSTSTEAVTGGFNINVNNASTQLEGSIILTLLNSSTNTWAAFGSFADIAISNVLYLTAGTKSLTATLDRVSITSTAGTETFDNGQINIAYM